MSEHRMHETPKRSQAHKDTVDAALGRIRTPRMELVRELEKLKKSLGTIGAASPYEDSARQLIHKANTTLVRLFGERRCESCHHWFNTDNPNTRHCDSCTRAL